MGKIGIALGSGGARGLAHIGVLEELAAMDIHPDFVAGTSIGSLVGAGYCTGNLEEMKALALEMDVRTFLFRFMDFGFPHSGIIEGKRINDMLEELMPEATFEELNIPLRCIATELKSGEEIVFSTGKLQPAIRASISIPGVFAPAQHEGRILVDGGLVNPIPVDQARDMGAEIILAVDVNQGCLQQQVAPRKPSRKPNGKLGEWLGKLEDKWREKDSERLEKIKEWFEPNPLPNLVDVMGGTIHIIENQVGRMRLKLDKPDLLLAPEVGDMEMFDFHHAEELIKAGRNCVRENADKIRACCQRESRDSNTAARRL